MIRLFLYPYYIFWSLFIWEDPKHEKENTIKKVLNNNVVFSKNKDGKDIILAGLGLGFQKKKGEFVDENKIEHIFKIESDDINTNYHIIRTDSIDYFYIADCIKN